ncbi:FtsQ-type POTRA domain-containing protein [Desulfobulbus sp. F4]|nr:FtsQ-type POTRA domain-containing protein [Desulfobulbus sp. F4]
MKKSQSPLVGSNRRRYRQHRAVRSGTFRRFRSAFAKEHGLPPVGNGPYRIAADSRQSGLLLRLSKTGILAGLLAVLLAMLVLRGWQLLEQSDVFRVRQITVQGCRTLREEQLLAWAELRQGVPLFSLKLPEAEQRLRQQPWVEQASIRRVWPDSLTVEVTERRPFARSSSKTSQSCAMWIKPAWFSRQLSRGRI